MYDFILTEGDLKRILSVIERKRIILDRPFCLQIHIEPGEGVIQVARMTVESLSRDMIAEMRAKGQIDLHM